MTAEIVAQPEEHHGAGDGDQVELADAQGRHGGGQQQPRHQRPHDGADQPARPHADDQHGRDQQEREHRGDAGAARHGIQLRLAQRHVAGDPRRHPLAGRLGAQGGDGVLRRPTGTAGHGRRMRCRATAGPARSGGCPACPRPRRIPGWSRTGAQAFRPRRFRPSRPTGPAGRSARPGASPPTLPSTRSSIRASPRRLGSSFSMPSAA